MSYEIGEFIFVRHGKEKSKENSAGEIKRVLTKTGHAELKRLIPYLKTHIEDDMNLYLWASQESSAHGTAEIIGSEMEKAEISDCGCIAVGDLVEFQDKVSQLEQPFCIVVVGDEPYLGDWSKEISDSMLSYEKGMAAGFKINSLQPLKGQPQWIIRSEALSLEALSISKDKSALSEYKKILLFHIQEVFLMQDELLKNQDDPEATHQLRVKIRALRSVLSFIKPLIQQEDYIKAQDSLRELGKSFAYLREIDVLIDQWIEVGRSHPEFASETGALADVLKKERSEEIGKVYREVSKGSASSILFKLYNWIENGMDTIFKQSDDGEDKITFEAFTKARFKSLWKKTDENFKKMDMTDLKSIHSMRIQYKKLRYVLNSIKPFLQLSEAVEIKELKDLQYRLGIVCDSHRNSAVLNDLNDKYKSPELLYESGVLTGYQFRLADEQITKLLKIHDS